MASKWKYADLDAQHRLNLLEKGYKEVFDEEVARTREVTKARRELGLDTTEQENWMDLVGYSYNSYLSDGSAPVSKTGYAELYLGDKKPNKTIPAGKVNMDRPFTGTPYFSDATRKIEKARKLAKKSAEEKYAQLREKAKDELYEKYPHLKEQLLNEGASPEGGKLKRAYELIGKKLSDREAELDVELREVLADIDKRYAGFKSELASHRDSGTAKESFGVIADVLIKNAAKKDGYDYTLIPGIDGKHYTGGKETDKQDEIAREEENTSDNNEPAVIIPEKSDDEVYDNSRDDEVTVETENENGITDKVRDGLYEIADMIKSNPAKAAAAMVKLLAANGFPDNGAAMIVGEILKNHIGKADKQA